MKKFQFSKITEIRKEIGMSKTELARRADLTPQQVWNLENSTDDKSLSVSTLEKIANALKVPPDAFFVEV
jgi:transcriptional regulator with XRE-family HTH domain